MPAFRSGLARLTGLAVCLLLPLSLGAVDPPNLKTSTVAPLNIPAPAGLLRLWLDCGLVLLALALSVWLLVARRSRRGLFWLSVVCLAYFGFYKGGCLCPVGAIQAVAQALGDPTYVVTLPAILFFVVPLATALFFGRVFCGAVCPLGAIQDLCAIAPRQLPAWVDRVFGLLPWAYLGLAVISASAGAAWIICDYDPFVALFRWSGSKPMVLLGLAFLVFGTVVARPYCRFLCPYGALLSALAPLSRWRLTIYPDACVQCRLCETACPFNAIRPAEAAVPAKQRRQGRVLLGIALVLTPLLMAGGAWLGGRAGIPLARLHPAVRLADLVQADRDAKRPKDLRAEEHKAFYDKQKGSYLDLQTRSNQVVARFQAGSRVLGLLLGLLAGLRLVATVVRRPRRDYEADPAACLSCARCFDYCPGSGKTHA